MSRWTDEQAIEAMFATMPEDNADDTALGITGPRARLRSLLDNDGEYSGNVTLARLCAAAAGRALLDARAESESKDAVIATLKAECRDSREMDRVQNDERHTSNDLYEAWQTLKASRAATDAALGKEGTL